MSTIASPRMSTSIRSAASSTRTSLDIPNSNLNSAAGGTASRNSTAPRRNRADRAALRDYYNLKASAGDGETGSVSGLRSPGIQSPLRSPGLAPGMGEEVESELDKEGFDVQGYVKGVLAREGLEGVLRIESRLMSDIRGLDGERKALVYDNYSKLIAATDTIRKMRTNMDPLTPTTSTLSPAISHIAETASALSTSLIGRHGAPALASATIVKEKTAEDLKKEKAQQTVKWVLDSPRRLRELVEAGRKEEAEKDWEEVKRLLEKWKGVDGVERVRKGCEEAIVQEEEDEDEEE